MFLLTWLTIICKQCSQYVSLFHSRSVRNLAYGKERQMFPLCLNGGAKPDDWTKGWSKEIFTVFNKCRKVQPSGVQVCFLIGFLRIWMSYLIAVNYCRQQTYCYKLYRTTDSRGNRVQEFRLYFVKNTHHIRKSV